MPIFNQITKKEDNIIPAIPDSLPSKNLVKSTQPIVSDNFMNGEERANIKSFFRVSKTTPNLPQKMVVQMLQMPKTHTNNHNSSLRHSLRSSTKKQNFSENIKLSETDECKQSCKVGETTIKIPEKTDDKKVENVNVSNDEQILYSQTSVSTLSTLYITTAEKSKSALNSPTNSTTSSLVSPTSCSSVPKKKKKLNDCIAMLTCKIQEKLGVNFFESATCEVIPHETALQPLQEGPKNEIEPLQKNSLLTLTPPLLANVPESHAYCEENSEKVEYNCPEQDQVIDLSLKRSVESDMVTTGEQINELVENKAENEKISLQANSCQVTIQQEIESKQEPSLDSFKISIPKDRIPELDEILEKQNATTVNTFNISESERKAFEEQKNRIMQILGKKTLSKTTKNKAPTKKQPLNKKALSSQNVATEKITQNPEATVKTNNLEHRGKQIETSQNIANPAIISQEHDKNHQKDECLNEISKGNTKARLALLPVLKDKKQIPPNIERTLKKNNKKKSLNKGDSLKEEDLTILQSQPDKNLQSIDNASECKEETKKTFIESNLQGTIEQVIKTTNRIRCRRLSVVVDPIVNLSGFQKNRKIRLTNNSQQNGFYDLLTNDQIFNAIKNTPQIKSELQKLETKKSAPNETANQVKVAVTKTKKTPKTKKKASKYANGKVMKVTRKKKKSTPKKIYIDKKEIEKIISNPPNEVNAKKKILPADTQNVKKLISEKQKSAIDQKSCKEKANVNIYKLDKKEIISQSEIKDETKILSPPTNESKENKMTRRNTKKVKNDQDMKGDKNDLHSKNKIETNPKLVPSKKVSNKSAQSLLDNVDETSDTSIENDIPLAKLLSSPKEKCHTTECNAIPTFNKKNLLNKPKNRKVLGSNKKSIKSPKLDETSKTPVEKNPSLKEEKNEIVKAEKSEVLKKNKYDSVGDKIVDASTHSPSSNKNLTSSNNITKDTFEKTNICSDDTYEIFSMNEDSFFNDDNDIDQANDKINALVNNIINSSELIDSESEKVETTKPLKATSCLICKKTFKNEKVWEKHIKTSTHLLKEKRKEKQNLDSKEAVYKLKQTQNMSNDETKIFRTKGALKTFDNILSVSLDKNNETKQSLQDFRPIVEDSIGFVQLKDNENLEDDDEELSTKDKIFDSLFSNIENKLQAAAKNEPLPKYDFPTLSHHDSESSSTSWDLKHDADIDWDAGNTVVLNNTGNSKNLHFTEEKNDATMTSNRKTCKTKEVVVPTKSLIMGKIFKKHREKQKTPQADAPNNKPGIKNSLDEIFDHLKNSAEIDDKVLTCPSPKTLLKTSSGIFSPNSSHSNDMLESASHSNHLGRVTTSSYTPVTEKMKEKSVEKTKEEEQDGIGKRKSRRRCAIKMKTFAETWSSDEYEELHDTNDIISIINEIEKRESTLKQKDVNELTSILKTNDCNSKKKVQVQFTKTWNDNKLQGLKKRRMNSFKESGHKSDDDLKTTPQISQASLKKRRMSCFVPSTTNFNENIHKKSTASGGVKGVENKIKNNGNPSIQKMSSSVTKINANNLKCENSVTYNSVDQPITLMPQNLKRKIQKHRKKPRNKMKNIAYDSDSDFELNLSKKLKTTASSTAYSESENEHEDEEEEEDIINHKSYNNTSKLTTITREQPKHSLPNDLNVVDIKATPITPKAAIPFDQEKYQNEASSTTSKKLQDSTSNRTKRHSSEKLYYWSSSSDSDDIEQGDMPEGGGNEHSTMIPEQHGWIVGDSHKKLVTLLAHAKIKNKIN